MARVERICILLSGLVFGRIIPIEVDLQRIQIVVTMGVVWVVVISAGRINKTLQKNRKLEESQKKIERLGDGWTIINGGGQKITHNFKKKS